MDSMDAIMDTNSSVYEEGNKFIVEYPDCVFVKSSVPPDLLLYGDRISHGDRKIYRERI